MISANIGNSEIIERLIKISKVLFYVYECFACLQKPEGGTRFPWNWSYVQAVNLSHLSTLLPPPLTILSVIYRSVALRAL